MLSTTPVNTINSSDYLNTAGNKSSALKTAGKNGHINNILSAEYYSSEKIDLSYTSKDGDTLTLSSEYIEYQKLNMMSNAAWSGDVSERTINKIIEEISNMHDNALSQLLDKTFGSDTKSEDAGKTQKSTINGLPEYWNAENTSQRIVDFAVSFLSMFEGEDSEFYDMIKGAIEEGFSQALGELGEIPEKISNLVNDTHNLTMEKIDKWAEQKGVNISGKENSPESIAQTV